LGLESLDDFFGLLTRVVSADIDPIPGLAAVLHLADVSVVALILQPINQELRRSFIREGVDLSAPDLALIPTFRTGSRLAFFGCWFGANLLRLLFFNVQSFGSSDAFSRPFYRRFLLTRS